MVGVDDYLVVVGHIAVEVCSATESRHILHTTHKFLADNHDWHIFGRHAVTYDVETFVFGSYALECPFDVVLLVCTENRFNFFFLADKVVDNVGINTDKMALSELLFKEIDEMNVKLTVHQQHIVAFALGCLNVRILVFDVGCI